MKYKFWKHKNEMILSLVMGGLISIAFIIMGIIFICKNSSFWPILMVGFFIPILTILIVYLDKRLLSKVVISDIGIEWVRFSKQILFLDWDEITEVKDTIYSIAARFLTFIGKDKRIDVELTKEMYNAIMSVCPDFNIKMQINSIKHFEYLHTDN